MRVFIAVLVLILSLQSLVRAEDISEFEIEGMSIGDSLLDFFSEAEIKKMYPVIYPKSKKYIKLGFRESNKFDDYEHLTFHVEENDKSYVIHTINGIKEFPNDLESCKSLKNTIVESFEPSAKNFKYQEYEYVYKTIGSGKSIAYISSYMSSSGAVRVYCTDWNELEEKELNNIDELNVDLSTREFLNFLDNEAYK